jgi:Tol biopolymer transport system component
MGEVFRARDVRLSRDVAIKVLPPGVTGDEGRLQRFQQEARATAALTHPNILAIYDVGTHESSPYIVTELLEGTTLRERIPSAGVPVRKAIDYAVQVARGLAAAHDKGIVHRDLKPENVFVTADGRLKILDFGLAKLIEEAPSLLSASVVPTSPPGTVPGVVLGTLGYMSPEQVRGRPADHRSDIFAFGTILYEMLAGVSAFAGETGADRMMAVLKEEPSPLPAAERQIPGGLVRIVERCLEKDPAARFQSAGDLAFALEALTTASSTAANVIALPSRTGLLARALRIAAGATVLTAAAAIAFWLRPAPADQSAIRFSIPMAGNWTLPFQAGPPTASGGSAAPLAVSPDGRLIAFIAQDSAGTLALWVRPLDSLEASRLPGTDGAFAPFWSPDSRFIGFAADGKLRKIAVSGGPSVPLCDVVAFRGGTWNADDVIVFASGVLWRVPAAGGAPVRVTSLNSGETQHARPTFLPGGRHILLRVYGGPTAERRPIHVVALDGSDRRPLLESSSTNVSYSAGHLLFLRDTTLMAQPFDPGRTELTGEAFPIAERVQGSLNPPFGLFSASPTGTVAYVTGSVATGSRLTWFDRFGNKLQEIGEVGDYGDVSLSPTGERAAVSIVGRNGLRDLWLVDMTRGDRTQFTFDQAIEQSPVWSRDGKQLVFSARRPKEILNLYENEVSGAADERELLIDGANKLANSWSQDGRFILYTSQDLGGPTGNDIWIFDRSERKSSALLQTRFNEGNPRFSPSGRWVVYQSNESGSLRVYTTSFPVAEGKWLVSSGDGSQARWSADGREIFYLTPDNVLMAAEVKADGPVFERLAVRQLFRITPVTGRGPSYDVSPDGQRILVNTQPPATDASSTITVVVNWLAGINR